MAKVFKTCRVCGKTYEACRTVSVVPGVFRWQEVACSPECGAIYLKKVKESRNAAKVPAKKIEIEETPVEEPAIVEVAEEPATEDVSVEAAEAPEAETDEVEAPELEASDIDPSED